MPVDPVDAWLAALEARHLATFTPAEVARALRALSLCYVERRAKLAHGGALDSAGKRAAFALFYGPQHYLVTRAIVEAIPRANRVTRITDLGCGTGVAGAAWSIACGRPPIAGYDRNPWVVSEANWTYSALGVPGRARQGDVDRLDLGGAAGAGMVAAFTVNELPEGTRARLLPRLLAAHERGAHVLVIEPIARRMSGWWDDWAAAAKTRRGRADEWRFPVSLPERQKMLARAAGLDPRELTARTLWL